MSTRISEQRLRHLLEQESRVRANRRGCRAALVAG